MTRHVLLLMLLAAPGCGRTFVPPEPGPLPPESAAAPPLALRVEGVVIDRWGYVIPNAWVTVRVGSPNQGASEEVDCSGASHLPTRTRTSPTGEFGVVVEAGRRPPFRACLEVEALPPRGLPWRENTTIVPSAPFAPVGPAGATETVRVRVILY